MREEHDAAEERGGDGELEEGLMGRCARGVGPPHGEHLVFFVELDAWYVVEIVRRCSGELRRHSVRIESKVRKSESELSLKRLQNSQEMDTHRLAIVPPHLVVPPARGREDTARDVRELRVVAQLGVLRLGRIAP